VQTIVGTQEISGEEGGAKEGGTVNTWRLHNTP
jgi:hypothetical protein